MKVEVNQTFFYANLWSVVKYVALILILIFLYFQFGGIVNMLLIGVLLLAIGSLVGLLLVLYTFISNRNEMSERRLKHKQNPHLHRRNK